MVLLELQCIPMTTPVLQVHSYSLALKRLKNTVYTTAVNDAPWHMEEKGIHYVNLWGFKRFFLSSIVKFKARITSDPGIIDNRIANGYASTVESDISITYAEVNNYTVGPVN